MKYIFKQERDRKREGREGGKKERKEARRARRKEERIEGRKQKPYKYMTCAVLTSPIVGKDCTVTPSPNSMTQQTAFREWPTLIMCSKRRTG